MTLLLCLVCSAPATLALSSAFTDEKRWTCDRCAPGMLHDFLRFTGAAVSVRRVAAPRRGEANDDEGETP